MAGQGWAAPLTAFWNFSRQDTEACGELRAGLGRAGEGGLGEEQLHQDHAHLEEPQEGRTRDLQQYMQVRGVCVSLCVCVIVLAIDFNTVI